MPVNCREIAFEPTIATLHEFSWAVISAIMTGKSDVWGMSK